MSPGASYHSRHYHIEGLLCMGWQGRRGVTKAYGKVSRITLEPFTFCGTGAKVKYPLSGISSAPPEVFLALSAKVRVRYEPSPTLALSWSLHSRPILFTLHTIVGQPAPWQGVRCVACVGRSSHDPHHQPAQSKKGEGCHEIQQNRRQKLRWDPANPAAPSQALSNRWFEPPRSWVRWALIGPERRNL